MDRTQVDSPHYSHPFADKIVAETRKWLGTPYRHQGTTKGAGTDCLGLVRGVWRAVLDAEPAKPPSYTTDWSEHSGEETLMLEADRHLKRHVDLSYSMGDILLFRMRDGSVAKHLGIVSKVCPTPKFIHAYTGHGVVESSLSEPWIRRIVAVYSFPEGAK